MGAILKLFGLSSPAALLGMALVFVLAVAGAGGWGYHMGDASGFNRAESARAATQDKAIAALDSQLTASRADALAEAAKAGALAAQADAYKASLSSAIRELRNAKNVPAATCIPDDWRVRVNAAVVVANKPLSGASDAGSLSIKLPGASGTGVGLKPLGIGPTGSGGGMPAPTSSVPGGSK